MPHGPFQGQYPRAGVRVKALETELVAFTGVVGSKEATPKALPGCSNGGQEKCAVDKWIGIKFSNFGHEVRW